MKSIWNHTPGMMKIPMFLYLLLNSAMNMAAMSQFAQNMTLPSLVTLAGAVFFFVSDCVLFVVRYHENHDIFPHHHFSVMLYYLLGELLITVGMLMMS